MINNAICDVDAGTVLGDPLETSLQGELASFLSSTDQLLNSKLTCYTSSSTQYTFMYDHIG